MALSSKKGAWFLFRVLIGRAENKKPSWLLKRHVVFAGQCRQGWSCSILATTVGGRFWCSVSWSSWLHWICVKLEWRKKPIWVGNSGKNIYIYKIRILDHGFYIELFFWSTHEVFLLLAAQSTVAVRDRAELKPGHSQILGPCHSSLSSPILGGGSRYWTCVLESRVGALETAKQLYSNNSHFP